MKWPRIEISPGAAVLFPLWYYLDRDGWFSAAVPAVLFHELGHAAALRCFARPVLCLRLELTGLCMEAAPLADPVSELLCLAAGPAAGFLWAMAARCLPGERGAQCAFASLWLNTMNLLPALPLDGGRILLCVSRNPAAVRVVSLVTAAAVFLAGLILRAWGLTAAGAVLAANAVRTE